MGLLIDCRIWLPASPNEAAQIWESSDWDEASWVMLPASAALVATHMEKNVNVDDVLITHIIKRDLTYRIMHWLKWQWQRERDADSLWEFKVVKTNDSDSGSY